MYEQGKVKKVPGSKLATTIYSKKRADFPIFEVLEEISEDL